MPAKRSRAKADAAPGKSGATAATGASAPRRRYTLAELLVGSEHLPELYEGVKGALDGPPVGREIA